MKKLLTIVALALVLCLGISAVLAESDLLKKQWDDIAVKLTNAGVLADSTKLKKDDVKIEKFKWSYTGTEVTGSILNCEDADGNHVYVEEFDDGVAHYYTYYEWDDENWKVNKDATKSAERPENEAEVSHYGDICEVRVCQRCGAKDTKVLVKKVDHYFGDLGTNPWSYSTTDVSKGNFEGVLFEELDKDDLKVWPCQEENAGKELYRYRWCEDCMATQCELLYKKAKGAHSYPATPEVIEASTCIKHGYKGYKCSVCGQLKTDKDGNEIKEYLPLGNHSYTKKVYQFQVDADKKPSCQNGFAFLYTYQCTGGCGQYEGDLMVPDFVKHGYIDSELTLDEKAKLLGWYGDSINNTKLYDADGHHYSLQVEPETGSTKYACESGYKWTYACEFCGKKLVIGAGDGKPAYNKGIVDADKTVYTDCWHAKVTYKCDYCEGKVAGHTMTKEMTFVDSDPLAHNGGKYFVEDLTKRVEPTCAAAGSQTLVCTECGYQKVVAIAKLAGHSYGDYSLVKVNENNEYVWEATCVFCGKTTIMTTKDKNKPKMAHWEKTSSVEGTCLEAAYTEYKLVNADGSDAKDYDDKLITKRVYGAYGPHIVVKVDNYPDEKKATCTSEGIELWICARCTNYNPNTPKAKVLADYMTYRGKLPGGTPYYVVKKTEKAAHTWGEAVVVPATAEKDGTSTKTCTVCGEVEVTVIPFEKGAAEYKFADVKFDGNILSGKLVHTAGTKDADKLSIRVTFFTAGNNYMTTTATIYADGTFEAEGAGDIEAITLVAYATDKVVNPADVATLTKLDAKEIVVK